MNYKVPLRGEHLCPKAALCSPAPPSHRWSGAPVAVQCEHPHWDALLWKAVLLLLAQHHQPTLPNEAVEDAHVPSHTAVREV